MQLSYKSYNAKIFDLLPIFKEKLGIEYEIIEVSSDKILINISVPDVQYFELFGLKVFYDRHNNLIIEFQYASYKEPLLKCFLNNECLFKHFRTEFHNVDIHKFARESNVLTNKYTLIITRPFYSNNPNNNDLFLILAKDMIEFLHTLNT